MSKFLEITSRDTLDPTIMEGDLAELVNDLNLAAAKGKQFVVVTEKGSGNTALETRNITRIREKDGDNAFVS
jgi:ABC-type microcin C transport system duplicated ATPase subunit YejF